MLRLKKHTLVENHGDADLDQSRSELFGWIMDLSY